MINKDNSTCFFLQENINSNDKSKKNCFDRYLLSLSNIFFEHIYIFIDRKELNTVKCCQYFSCDCLSIVNETSCSNE